MANTFHESQPNPCSEHHLAVTREIKALERKDSALSTLRFATVAVAVIGVYLGWSGWGPGYWFAAILSCAFFVILLSYHDRVFHFLGAMRRRQRFLERSARRVANGADPDGPEGLDLVPKEHPGALDLHLFGPGSLFATLCLARTRHGHQMLADWLLDPAPVHEAKARAEAVSELKGKMAMRLHRMGLLPESPSGISLETAVQWGESRLPAAHPATLLIATLLALFNISSLILWAGSGGPLSLFLLGVLLTAVFYSLHFDRLRKVFGPIRKQAEALGMLAPILKDISEAPWESPRLREIGAAAGNRSDQSIRALATILIRWRARMNQLVAPLAFLVHWDFFFAQRIVRWHGNNGPKIRGWIEAVAQFEALDSLAHQAFLFPQACFPEISDSSNPFIRGEDLAHPLIPPDRCVANDVDLSPPVRLMLISGSNMSGKSTYMRTVGINAVLGLAGGPVHAKRMSLTPLRIVATLQIQDSLSEGLSRFGAELARLRQVIHLSHARPPLLFLLDEVFSGTNSRDRLAGARSLIRDLINRNGIGMVTTHDLALAEIPGELGNEGANFHFVEKIENGSLGFDYKLKAGVVVGSNAQSLMRAIGIQVPQTGS